MKKKFRKIWAFVTAIALIATSVTWPEIQTASAAVTAPDGDWTESSLLSSSVSSDTESLWENDNNGYFQTVESSNLTGSYFKIVYTVTDSAAFSEDTEIVNFQPFDTSYGGWNNNKITFSDSQEDDDGSYVAYISIASIEESLSTGNTFKGINLSFCNATPVVTLTGFYMLTEETDDEKAEAAVTITGEMGDGNGHETLQAVSAGAIMAADEGISYDEIVTNNAKVYVHITKCTEYSRLKISGGDVVDVASLSSSNKELVGRKCTTSSNTNYRLHAGYRTVTGTHSGVGVAESGNYVFPANGMNKGQSESTAGVLLRRMTTDVDGYIIGIVFAGGKSVTLDKDGNISATDFDPDDYNLESTETDDSDYTDEEWAALDEEEAAAAEEERLEAYSGLTSAISGCEALDEDYYEADSWTALQEALETAKEAAEITDSDKQTYRDARDALEDVRTAMVPKASADTGNPKSFRILSKSEVIDEMGAGINLGNTLDGHTSLTPSETSWQAYKTTKEYIKALHDAGYNTVRIPVTWGTMINDDYSINTAWMARVQEIVDYCVEQDMYCIINIHHDGAANHDTRGDNTPMCWLDTAATDIEAVYAKFEGVWKSIAENFKDYDEHLIFESMNEVTDDHSSGLENEDTQILNNLNQLFVNTVRATGSNNTKRWLAITGRFATFSTGTTLPTDSLVDEEATTTRMMFSVHIYKNNSSTRWTYSNLKDWQSSLSSTYKNVQNLDSNMPIYVGEYGVRTQTQSGSDTGYNNAERALNYEFCAATADFYGVVPIVWDQGSTDYTDIQTQTGLFTDWDRPNLSPVYDDVVEGTIRGSYLSYSSDLSTRISGIYTSYGHSSTSNNSVSSDPDITEITALTLSEDSLSDNTLTMTAGERVTVSAETTPSDTNDVVLWSTDDDSVATVSKGLVHAKKAGVTTIYAYSQSGSVKEEIKVVVTKSGNETATAISTEKAYYSITQGDTVTINTTLTPSNSTDEVTYTSSNTSVATVNSSGVVTAVSAGSAFIIVTAASGVSTIVNIYVPGSNANTSVSVALRAYFNAGEVVGSPVTITGDGQYTVSIDLSEDLTAANQSAGISALEDVVSIYIKDENSSTSTVEEAQIRYDSVVVDGTELTLKSAADLYSMWSSYSPEIVDDTCYKSALKASGVFDTNDPINGWDGSVVSDSEITTNSLDHTVSFNNITSPQTISVTFTIRNLSFYKTSEKENEATSMTTTDSNIIKMDKAGDTSDITLSLTPTDTDSYVTVYSTDTSVVAVDNTAQAVDENGNVTATLTAVGEGTAVVVAITENLLKVLYSVGVGDVEVSEPTDPTPDGLDGKTTSEEPTNTEDTGTQEPSSDAIASTDSLKVKKSSVIVAAGKSVSVGYTASSTPTVKTSNKKVATAKVSGGKIKISVPKSAKKGASGKITVSVGSKSAVIKVTVKNPAKKIKAVRKNVTVKKKKTATVKFKITATNKKKPAADTIKATVKKKKIAKVVKYSIKKGKATVKVKGLKKGKTTLTLKIGKKSAKVTIKVK